jgi:hypothetical protein
MMLDFTHYNNNNNNMNKNKNNGLKIPTTPTRCKSLSPSLRRSNTNDSNGSIIAHPRLRHKQKQIVSLDDCDLINNNSQEEQQQLSQNDNSFLFEPTQKTLSNDLNTNNKEDTLKKTLLLLLNNQNKNDLKNELENDSNQIINFVSL